MTPAAYRRITRIALWSLVAIIVTGGAVRLTGSGLGCSDWPTCEENQFVPDADLHGWVEFGNRLVTGVVSAIVIVAVLGALRRVPRRPDLTRWAWGLVIGVVGQVILGGITVLTHLSPPIVMGHFLLSMVLVWNAAVLDRRAATDDDDYAALIAGRSARNPWVWAIGALTTVAVFTGTVVTASGPHGGDEEVTRLGFALPDVARVHGASVIALIGLTILVRARATSAADLRRALDRVLFVMIAQATIGYVQYFTGVPVVLVAVHIAGASMLWLAIVRLVVDHGRRHTQGIADMGRDNRAALAHLQSNATQ